MSQSKQANQPRIATKSDLLASLAQNGNSGAQRGVTARRLCARLGCHERHLRTLITELREDGIAVCGTPRDDTCRFLRARAMKSLQLEARLRRIPLPELLGQLRLET